MKRIFTILAAVLLTASVFAQSPEKMSYQAVIRNSSDALVTNTQIGMQISILQGSTSGTAVYVETQMPTTNANGLVSLKIGAGTVVSGDFTAIDWANGPYFIKTETAVEAPLTTYTITGTSLLLSVPYALHAKTAETVTGGITETDPVYSGSQAVNITATDISNLSNLSGTNTGDQDLSTLATKTTLGDSTAQVRSEIPDVSGIATNTQAIQDTASQIRADIPTDNNQLTNGAGYLTSETDPSIPTGTRIGQMQYWDGTEWITVDRGSTGQVLAFINGKPTWWGAIPTAEAGEVQNPTTGAIWMDKNLGASQVATSSTDADAYGDLYQWGRGTDGHEKRSSSTTSTLSSSDTPGHGNFIITNDNSPDDWRSPQNDNLWQDVSGTNNPCPSGYRLPTAAEWEAERTSWSSNNRPGAFASPLKLPAAGYRDYRDGSLTSVDATGYYWSSTVNGTGSRNLFFGSSIANLGTYSRAGGSSVRCIKD
jgi:uncharacterized protein (TIGR02145 family)